MAIDTAEKRASCISMVHAIPNNVTPNATPDQEWRQQSGWAYSGIAVAEPAEALGIDMYLMPRGLMEEMIRWHTR